MSQLLSNLRQFNRAGRGGPARILTIAGIGASMTALAIGASFITHPPAPSSSVAKMPEGDPLPGGLHSNPAQESLLTRHAQEKAEKALAKGESYTPPLPGAVPLKMIHKPAVEEVGVSEPPTAEPVVGPVPEPAPVYVPPETSHDETPRIEKIAASEPTNGNEDPQYKQAVADLMKHWEGRPPRTDVVITPAADLREELPATKTRLEPAAIAPHWRRFRIRLRKRCWSQRDEASTPIRSSRSIPTREARSSSRPIAARWRAIA
ncbi:hypothetical protein WOB59_00845 [Methylocystis sp. IM4]|uniref:hypothetical protein n=1 Tax=Methylocystis sp. IM4 TaxID=3136560 RepID=UPI0031195F38